MATNRIKGITIEIGGDVKPLTEALKTVNSSLKDTESQLADVNKLLKLDPGNIALTKQKIDLLTDSFWKLNDKNVELNLALQKNEKSLSPEKIAALNREIIETKEKMHAAALEIKSMGGNLDLAAEATITLSDKAGLLQNKFKVAAEATQKMSAVAKKVANSLLDSAVNAGKAADDLNTLAKQTGLSTEELQKMNYAQALVDVSTKDMTSSIQKMVKQIGAGDKTFETLGVSIRDENGELRDSITIWYEVLDALSKVENETERDILAQEIFGNAAMDLAGIIDDGGRALKEFGQEAEEAGIILSQETLDSANQFNDAMDKMKSITSGAFAEIGAKLATALLPVVEKLADIVKWLSKLLDNIPGPVIAIVTAIAGVVAAIAPLLSALSGVMGIVSAIAGAGGIGALVAAIGSALAAALPVIGVIAGIVAAIVAVIAIIKHWDEITNWISETWKKFTDWIGKAWESLKDTAKKVFTALGEFIMQPFVNWYNFIVKIIDKVKSIFKGFKLELPKIKLPHFKIDPPGWSIGDLFSGSIPKLNIEWYKKAMEGGRILKSPTIFGASNGALLAGGEAGPEAVVGVSSLRAMIRDAAGGNITIPVYIGSEKIDTVIAKSNRNRNFRSGGR